MTVEQFVKKVADYQNLNLPEGQVRARQSFGPNRWVLEWEDAGGKTWGIILNVAGVVTGGAD